MQRLPGRALEIQVQHLALPVDRQPFEAYAALGLHKVDQGCATVPGQYQGRAQGACQAQYASLIIEQYLQPYRGRRGLGSFSQMAWAATAPAAE
ncbi:hypothetical protein D3C76_1648050 [compost metagenome]